jgi:catechol 2,3-dioxygenase-like lactoylglutathione lyase family enzyme
MMLHHVSVGSRDVARAAAFYDKVFKALGYRRVMEFLPYAVGYGEEHPEFWVGAPADGKTPSVGNGVHISFVAASKRAVNAFHAAAIRAGGTDEGAPGPRPDYGPNYYGGFCRDLDGNKLEAAIIDRPAKKSGKANAKKATGAAKRGTKAARGGKAKPSKMKVKRRK